mmetsp:Transcript_7298/g.12061  ORF Transcript_7298/g.12061 Transcript_7298/m.12061 type:complete len:150 (-) Transcript_7298:206-655(-)
MEKNGKHPGTESLPRASIIRIAKEVMEPPFSRSITAEVALTLNGAADRFVRDLVKRALGAAEESAVRSKSKAKRRTIDTPHVASALEECGARHMVDASTAAAAKKGDEVDVKAKKKRQRQRKVTPEEEHALAMEQEELIRKSKEEGPYI